MAKAAMSNENMQMVLGVCLFNGIRTPKIERKAWINLSCFRACLNGAKVDGDTKRMKKMKRISGEFLLVLL